MYQSRLSINHHLEINTDRNNPHSWNYGRLDLTSAESEKNDLDYARNRSIATPYPAAIIRLDEISYEGKKMDTGAFLAKLGFSKNVKLALFIRLYPLSSTRVSDIIFQRLRLPLGADLTENGQIHSDIARMINSAQETYINVEFPRLCRYANDPSMTPNDIFNQAVTQITSNISAMINHNFSPLLPVNGRLSTQIHLQNTTTSGIETEWTPTITIPPNQCDERTFHISELVECYQQTAIALALMAKMTFDRVHPVENFINNLRIKNNDKKRLLMRYGKNNFIERVSLGDAFIETLTRNSLIVL